MRRKAAFSVSIVTLGRPLVLYFGFWPTLPLLSTATGMLPIFMSFSLSLFLHPSLAHWEFFAKLGRNVYYVRRFVSLELREHLSRVKPAAAPLDDRGGGESN